MTLKHLNISANWTLFLDRDGVINKRLKDDYVKVLEEFEFIDAVPDALKIFNSIFSKIIVVTNQQGIGKGIYTENDLSIIHHYMIDEIEQHGGRIDKVYFSPYLAAENHEWRKPNTGMAHQAKIDFPEINFHQSVMVGDSMSDMEFGKKCGMTTVFISEEKNQSDLIDYHFDNLFQFAQSLL